MQTRITKSSLSSAWKTLVSGTVRLFHKFEEGYLEWRCWMRGGRENLWFPANTALAERDRSRPLVSTSKTLWIISRRSSGALWRLILFYWAFKHAPLLRIPLCVSSANLVHWNLCVCVCVCKVEGTFRVRKPAVLLGYTHDSYSTSADVMVEAHGGHASSENTYVTLFVTIEPQLAAPEPFHEKVCSQLSVPFSSPSDFLGSFFL